MRVLFVHQNFPAQYVHLALALAANLKNEVVALCINSRKDIPNLRTVRYSLKRGSTVGIHPLAEDFEAKMLRGESAALAALTLKGQGFSPDIICGHTGWGETIFLKDVWPEAKLLSFLEFFYKASGADVAFDPEFSKVDQQASFKVRSKNAGLFLALDASDAFVSPTRWQARQFPSIYAKKIDVIHDGIDTDILKPNAAARITLGRDRVTLGPEDEIITFVNRNLEPYRGYHIFMRSLPEIMQKRRNVRIVIVGGNDVSYGAPPPQGQTYRELYFNEILPLVDASRIHFVGNIPYSAFLALLQVSSVHIYLTYPFVLSWSLIEAMATECAIVASATPPVEEFISNCENGILVDFFSPEAIAKAVVAILEKPEAYKQMRKNARETAVTSCDLTRVCLPNQIALINRLIA